MSEKPEIYYSFYQLPDDAVTAFRGQVTLTVRSSFDSAAVLPAIKSAVYEAGSDQPIYNIRTMQELVSGSMGRQRFSMLLLVGFAILALLLACVGIYGVISYSMAQRVREFGIRMALGATRQDILQMVIGQSLRLALTGVAIGAVAAFSLARLLSSFRLLYGVRASDPLAFVTASSVLLGAALLACYVPARRAAQLDPIIALRNE